MSKITFAVSAVTVALLTACGGGGDDSPAVATNSSFPLAQVADALIKASGSLSVRMEGTASAAGQSFPLTGTGSVSTSNTASSFEGTAGVKRTSTTTGTLQANGVSIPIADTSADFFGADNKPLGRTATGAYCVYANQTVIPVTAKIGDTAAWYSGTCYTGSSKTTKTGTTQVSYVLEPDTDTTAILKLVQKLTPTNGQTATATYAYRINTTGAITRLTESASLTDSGVLINLTISYL